MKLSFKPLANALSGLGKAFMKYPASMVCAIAVAVAATINVADMAIDSQVMLQSLMFAFFAGSTFNLAATSAIRKWWGDGILQRLTGLVGLIVPLFAFFLVNADGKLTGTEIFTLMSVQWISLAAFTVIPTYKNERLDFSGSVFMILKLGLISLIYSAVLGAGLSLVVGAVKILLYKELSSDWFAYIWIYSFLMGYAIFLGNYPGPRTEDDEGRIESATRHPRFIEILLEYIAIPIIAVLSIVLLIWVLRILLGGGDTNYSEVFGIVTAYSQIGLALLVLIANYGGKIASLFKKVFPYANILFLMFEAYFLIKQLSDTGLKVGNYAIIMFWIFALVCSVVYIFKHPAKSRIYAYLSAGLLLVSILPVVGHAYLPVRAQVARLEKALISQNMLTDGKITPNPQADEQAKKTIQDATNFLESAEVKSQLPDYLDWLKDLNYDPAKFKSQYGFDMLHNVDFPDAVNEKNITLNPGKGSLDLAGYTHYVSLVKGGSGEFEAAGGSRFELTAISNYSGNENSFTVTVKKSGQVVYQQNLNEFFNGLYEKYSGMQQQKGMTEVPYEDLTFKFEAGGVRFMILTEFVNIYWSSGNKNYMTNLTGFYYGE